MSGTVTYTDPELVEDLRTKERRSGQTVSGYGGAVPTEHMIKYLGVWRRVYVMTYGNGSVPYVKVAGVDVVLDSATRDRLIGGAV